jgi:chemotaxis family two-component system response regulator Rcp1
MPIEILLIEDDLGDVRLTREAFRGSNKLIYIHTVSDGVQAMAFLSQKGAYAYAPRPDIIMLDLGLPVTDGRELLSLIKKDESMSSIPIVVVTDSDNETDLATTFSNGLNAYHKKPVRWDAFEALVKQMNDFWMHQDDAPP